MRPTPPKLIRARHRRRAEALASALIERALAAPDGLPAAVRDAEAAVLRLPDRSGSKALAQAVLGAAALVDGDHDRAAQALAASLDTAFQVGAERALVLAATAAAALSIEDDDWLGAAGHIGEASGTVARGGVEDEAVSACFAVMAARVAIRRNDVGAARRHIAAFVRGKPGLTRALPWLSARFLLEAAAAYLALADPAGARAALWQADDVLHPHRGQGDLEERVATLRGLMRRLPPGPGGASTLTPAEVRVLALLPTYLSVPEIADRLGVSPSTVRTQVQSIFGKLGASSRREAVEAAVETRLLGPDVLFSVRLLPRDDVPGTSPADRR